MAPAVSAVLAEVFSQPTAWNDLGNWLGLPGCQANRKSAPQAGGVPPSRRNLWLTQAPGFPNLNGQNAVVSGITASMLLSIFSRLKQND